MFKEFKKKITKMNDELDDADYVSAELQEQFYLLENELEEAIDICFENEKGKMENY